MKRLILSATIFLVSVGAASVVAACINDSESERYEERHQERYELVEAEESPPHPGAPYVLAGIGLGGVALVGSLGYSLYAALRAPVG